MENMQLEILNLIIKSMAVSINRAESAIQMMRTGQAYPGDVTPLLDEFLLTFQILEVSPELLSRQVVSVMNEQFPIIIADTP